MTNIKIEYTYSEDPDPKGDHIVVTPPDVRVCDADYTYFGEGQENEAKAFAEELQDAYKDEFREAINVESELAR